MAWIINTHHIPAPVPASMKWFAWYERQTPHGLEIFGRGWGRTEAEAKIELHAKYSEHLETVDEEAVDQIAG